MRGRSQCPWLPGDMGLRVSIVEEEVDFSSDRYFKLQGCVWTEKDLLSPKSYHTGCVNTYFRAAQVLEFL